MKILITGGCGYLGSVLIEHLLENTDCEIIVLDNLLFGYDIQLFDNKRIELIPSDIRYFPDAILPRGIDTMVHLAALSNDASADINPVITHEINVRGTELMLGLCIRHHIKKFLFASTSSIYGFNDKMVDETAPMKPLSIYGKSKMDAEEIIQSYSNVIDDIIIMRFATIFGYSRRFRTDLVVNTMIKDALLTGEINVVGDGSQWRPHIHVKDLAWIISMFINNQEKRCEIYNLVDFNMPVKELAERLAELFLCHFNKKIKINYSGTSIGDKRSYNISNRKFLMNFGYDFEYNFLYAIDEIVKACGIGEIKDLNNPIYDNTKWIYHLLEMRKIIMNIQGDIL